MFVLVLLCCVVLCVIRAIRQTDKQKKRGKKEIKKERKKFKKKKWYNNKKKKWLARLPHVREGPGSSLGPDTCCKVLCGFPQSVQANVWMVP
jgi:hypothetical protein